MNNSKYYIIVTSLIVALGGFLMGFDASVISGVIKFIEIEFELTKIQLGWSVSSLTLTSTLAMLFAGPISDKYGRRMVLKYAAVLYAVSAIGSALAPSFIWLVVARMIGGLGVGASLIIAPMYIAEIAPPESRGRLVSFNQLNIVLGISVAFFTNYLILAYGKSGTDLAQALKLHEWNWRWMLGIEFLPALLYFLGLFFVPRSPRWLIMQGETEEAENVMHKALPAQTVEQEIAKIKQSIFIDKDKPKAKFKDIFAPAMKVVLTIGIVIGALQQITGINSVFFYAPMIFEQSGIGTDASFIQAIFVGLTNLVFTIVAILFIDKLGRKPLLIFGTLGIAITMSVLAYSFASATYELTDEKVAALNTEINKDALAPLVGKTFSSDLEYKNAIIDALGMQATTHQSELIAAAINMNAILVLIGIIGFVASFAVSLGPVMWVLFSELFPNAIRGIAISFVGLINSGVSFLVQLVFPWELATFGNATTFLIYGAFALAGLFFVLFKVPETKGKSLEEIEKLLVR